MSENQINGFVGMIGGAAAMIVSIVLIIISYKLYNRA